MGGCVPIPSRHRLQANQLTGLPPVSLYQLHNVTELQLSLNRMSCVLEVPDDSLPSLQPGQMDILVGNLFTCPIPGRVQTLDIAGHAYVCGNVRLYVLRCDGGMLLPGHVASAACHGQRVVVLVCPLAVHARTHPACVLVCFCACFCVCCCVCVPACVCACVPCRRYTCAGLSVIAVALVAAATSAHKQCSKGVLVRVATPLLKRDPIDMLSQPSLGHEPLAPRSAQAERVRGGHRRGQRGSLTPTHEHSSRRHSTSTAVRALRMEADEGYVPPHGARHPRTGPISADDALLPRHTSRSRRHASADGSGGAGGDGDDRRVLRHGDALLLPANGADSRRRRRVIRPKSTRVLTSRGTTAGSGSRAMFGTTPKDGDGDDVKRVRFMSPQSLSRSQRDAERRAAAAQAARKARHARQGQGQGQGQGRRTHKRGKRKKRRQGGRGRTATDDGGTATVVAARDAAAKAVAAGREAIAATASAPTTVAAAALVGSGGDRSVDVAPTAGARTPDDVVLAVGAPAPTQLAVHHGGIRSNGNNGNGTPVLSPHMASSAGRDTYTPDGMPPRHHAAPRSARAGSSPPALRLPPQRRYNGLTPSANAMDGVPSLSTSGDGTPASGGSSLQVTPVSTPSPSTGGVMGHSGGTTPVTDDTDTTPLPTATATHRFGESPMESGSGVGGGLLPDSSRRRSCSSPPPRTPSRNPMAVSPPSTSRHSPFTPLTPLTPGGGSPASPDVEVGSAPSRPHARRLFVDVGALGTSPSEAAAAAAGGGSAEAVPRGVSSSSLLTATIREADAKAQPRAHPSTSPALEHGDNSRRKPRDSLELELGSGGGSGGGSGSGWTFLEPKSPRHLSDSDGGSSDGTGDGPGISMSDTLLSGEFANDAWAMRTLNPKKSALKAPSVQEARRGEIAQTIRKEVYVYLRFLKILAVGTFAVAVVCTVMVPLYVRACVAQCERHGQWSWLRWLWLTMWLWL